MNILLVNPFYYPNMIGGAEHSVKLLAENLRKAGNNVAVFTMDGKPDADIIGTQECINGVVVYRGHSCFFSREKHLGKTGGLGHLACRLSGVYNPSVKGLLKKVCDDFKPDVAHTNNVYGISCYCWEFFYKRHIPVVHTIRDYFLLDPTARIGGTQGAAVRLYQAFLRKSSIKHVDVVTAPSWFALNAFLNSGYFRNSKKEVVYNSVKIDEAETGQIIRQKKQRTDPVIRFLFVGALNHNKGIDRLLGAFRKMKTEKAHLTICGSGEMEGMVNQCAKEDRRIEYRGQLSSAEMKKAYLEADVLVAPSTWDEPFGRIIIEGNQYGLPVIGSNKAGILETIEHMKSGRTVNADSEDEIQEAMEAFLNRREYIPYYQSILTHIMDYSVEYQIARFMEIYQPILR